MKKGLRPLKTVLRDSQVPACITTLMKKGLRPSRSR